ncbi:MAG TPA: hypothetical protein VGN80_12860 [Devosiaceae bacterium]|nr:hypothetical protein [Devosiaceae bacterium]
MDQNKTSLERAFDLARSGDCRSVTEIRTRLKSEGYNESDITGGALLKQLRALIEARASESGR